MPKWIVVYYLSIYVILLCLCLGILTVETCDERIIPAVNHTTYDLSRFATSIPPSLRQEFSVPNHVNVTYTCEKGYRLQDPNSNVIGCQYVTTPRKFNNGSIHETVVAKAVWGSTDGIICEKGEKIII